MVAGGYQDWERQRAQRVAPTKSGTAKRSAAAAPPPPPPARVKLTYKDQRDYDLLPKRIETLEGVIARDEATLADPGLYARDFARFDMLTKAIEAARTEKEVSERRWLELAELVEG